jgi:CHAD domain-containing protein
VAAGFRLHADEPVGVGVARVVTERVEHALEQLEGHAGPTPAKAVHEARKDMKRLRALLRLMRGSVDRDAYRRENAAFRDIGRSLSGARDAEVMLATLDALEERDAGALPPESAGLRRALEAQRREIAAGGDGGHEAVALLREARARVPAWTPHGDGFELLEDGLERTYRAGRRGWLDARGEPGDETWHGWRKQAKYLWHQVELLEELWPPIMEPLGHEAHALADRLGDDHDLAVLLRFAAGQDAPLDELVAGRRAELQADALRLGARLYAERPGAYARHMRALWEAWRGG